MKKFEVILFSFWNGILFSKEVEAEDPSHAIRITSAIYNKCWRNASVKELP
jgi:hypothetical protein